MCVGIGPESTSNHVRCTFTPVARGRPWYSSGLQRHFPEGLSSMPQSHRTRVRTIEWNHGRVVMIDQRLLPAREVYRVYTTYREVARAIKEMVIRGAPAIGVAAAMGIALGVRALRREELRREFDRICRTFAATRPT